ncbi:hypothetical protein E2C01_024536 [Portunus trituberculatus]|uniref:Uncharacterized protein n=1 Tax=Portunus trituberculatus TaxID=210409 RepID=A0A5B7EAU4_PORTR|nr:hypothetical protein [Portunus trituberculatus]
MHNLRLVCGRHSFLSFYLARDISTCIFFSVDSSSTPKEEQPPLQHPVCLQFTFTSCQGAN